MGKPGWFSRAENWTENKAKNIKNSVVGEVKDIGNDISWAENKIIGGAKRGMTVVDESAQSIHSFLEDHLREQRETSLDSNDAHYSDSSEVPNETIQHNGYEPISDYSSLEAIYPIGTPVLDSPIPNDVSGTRKGPNLFTQPSAITKKPSRWQRAKNTLSHAASYAEGKASHLVDETESAVSSADQWLLGKLENEGKYITEGASFIVHEPSKMLHGVESGMKFIASEPGKILRSAENRVGGTIGAVEAKAKYALTWIAVVGGIGLYFYWPQAKQASQYVGGKAYNAAKSGARAGMKYAPLLV